MGTPKPITVDEGLTLEFDTPSKKVEFWSDQLAKAGFDAVPKFTRHERGSKGYYCLITGRCPVHTFSRTQSNPLLRDLVVENQVWVNITTAAKEGLKNGQYVQMCIRDSA